MSGFGNNGALVAKRFSSAVVDWTIEIGGGVLGSYFGVMVAALLMAVRNEPADELQHSMWNGMGFGFVFCSLSIGFINRVLIQGLSRASLGKKLFKLELISSGGPLTWTTMLTRWVMSYVSIAAGGLGYAYLLFNKEARAFHDVVAQTDVVPAYAGVTMSVEYRETITPQIPLSLHGMSRLMILSNTQAERPTANVIRLPVRAALDAAIAMSGSVPGATPVVSIPKVDTGTSVAEVIQLRPLKEHEDDRNAA